MMLVGFICSLLLVSRPQKIGKVEILNADPGWQANYDQYQPDARLIEKIKEKTGHDLRVDVYLGLWCSDSLNNVPPFIKIIDLIDNDDVTVAFFDVKREDKKGTPYFVEELKIERVPTFIFIRNGREIGRIIENPEKNLVEDILAILNS